jgi:hypothetical protein
MAKLKTIEKIEAVEETIIEEILEVAEPLNRVYEQASCIVAQTDAVRVVYSLIS